MQTQFDLFVGSETGIELHRNGRIAQRTNWGWDVVGGLALFQRFVAPFSIDDRTMLIFLNYYLYNVYLTLFQLIHEVRTNILECRKFDRCFSNRCEEIGSYFQKIGRHGRLCLGRYVVGNLEKNRRDFGRRLVWIEGWSATLENGICMILG